MGVWTRIRNLDVRTVHAIGGRVGVANRRAVRGVSPGSVPFSRSGWFGSLLCAHHGARAGVAGLESV